MTDREMKPEEDIRDFLSGLCQLYGTDEYNERASWAMEKDDWDEMIHISALLIGRGIVAGNLPDFCTPRWLKLNEYYLENGTEGAMSEKNNLNEPNNTEGIMDDRLNHVQNLVQHIAELEQMVRKEARLDEAREILDKAKKIESVEGINLCEFIISKHPELRDEKGGTE